MSGTVSRVKHQPAWYGKERLRMAFQPTEPASQACQETELIFDDALNK